MAAISKSMNGISSERKVSHVDKNQYGDGMNTDEQYLLNLKIIGEIANELGCIDEYNYIVDLYNNRNSHPTKKPKPWIH